MAAEPKAYVEPAQPLAYWFRMYQFKVRGGLGLVTIMHGGCRWYLRASASQLIFAPLGISEPRVSVRWSLRNTEEVGCSDLVARRIHANAGLLADPLDGEQLTLEYQEGQARSLPEALRTICRCSVALLNRRTPQVGHVR